MLNKKSINVIDWRRRVKKKLIEYKGGKCSKCGYDKDFPAVYHFHHVDPSKKSFCINGKTVKFSSLKEEVDKCILLCANCHSEEHDRIRMEKRKDIIERIPNSRRERGSVKCEFCLKTFNPNRRTQKFCSRKCFNQFRII